MLKLWWRSLFLAGVSCLLVVPLVWVEDRVVAQPKVEERSPVDVKGVRLNPTANGLEVLLETTSTQPLTVVTSGYGKTYVANIVNAQLTLPEGKSFRVQNPNAGITVVSVTQQGANGIRITAISSEGLPTAKVKQSNGSTIFSLIAPTAATAQTPTPAPPERETVQPQTPTQPGETVPEAQEEISAPAEPEPLDGTAQGDEEIEIVVTGEQETEGYSVPDASTATRTDTPLRDIPASIQVIPQQVIEDQGVTRLQDAVRNNAPGLTTEAAYTFDGNFIIRGFAQNFNFVNGYRGADNYAVTDLANVERIEVLRGPASVLFGQLQPGGIVNIVTEEPLREPTYTVEFTGGQFSFYRPEIDFSGPLTEDGNLRYRLNAAYQNSGSFRDFVNEERFYVAPVLQWDVSEDTSITVDFVYQFSNSPLDSGIVALSDDSLVLPIDRFIGYPSLIDFDVEQFRASYRLEHQFNDDWRIRNAFSFFARSYAGPNDNYGSLIDDRFVPVFYYEDENQRETYLFQTDLIGKFSTGSIGHELLVGLDYTRLTDIYRGGSVELPLFDIFNPNYDVSRPDPPPEDSPFVTLTDSIGIYLQDQIQITDNLHLLLGGRVDFADQENYSGGSETTSSDTAFSPRVGVVYQPIEPLSLYASYSRSFFPVVGRSRTDSAFNPERGTQYEVGIKVNIYDNLSATLAAFDITKSNVLATDPVDSDFSIQVGEQRSQGVEFILQGEILPGWNIVAGYAYTDARVTEDNSIPEGDVLKNVPRNAANLWTTYKIQGGDFQGLGFGLGLVFVDERESGLPNISFVLPSYVRADASLFYRRDNWRSAINVNNLFDTQYYETSYGRQSINPGAPSNVTASFSYTF